MNKETYLTEYPKHESMRENVKKDKNRLHFHMMPPTGWMNDPNGLCEFQGVNHIYFQYTPFLAGWGTKLWGQGLDSLKRRRAVPLSGRRMGQRRCI